MGPEYADYALENVTAAVDFMLEIFETCIDAPKPQKVELAKWADDIRQSVSDLQTLRGRA